MKQRIRTLQLFYLSALSIFLSYPLPAKSVIIDFDIPVDMALQFQTADYFEDGFRMQLDSGHYDLQGLIGNHYLMVDNLSTDVESRPTSQVTFDFFGDLFDLFSFEFKLVDVSPTDPSNIVTMTSSAGGFLDLAAAYSGTSWLTFDFSGSEWQNLTWLSFTTTQPVFQSQGEQILLDNIHFEPSKIPEPNSLALMSLALIIMVLRFRSKDFELKPHDSNSSRLL